MVRLTRKMSLETFCLILVVFQDSEDDSEDDEAAVGDGTPDDVIRKAMEEAARKDEEMKEDYYSIAHTISEQITSQPTILIGGDLKEYQLKG